MLKPDRALTDSKIEDFCSREGRKVTAELCQAGMEPRNAVERVGEGEESYRDDVRN